MKKVVRNNFSNIVHRRLSEILLFETKDPRFKKVTISKVNVAPSMTSAKVLVSIFPSTGHQEIVHALNKAAGFFSTQLGKFLKTRNTPQLTFMYDIGFDHSDDIEILLRNVNQKDWDPSKNNQVLE